MLRLAYLVTHPIQYQAPLLRRVAAEPDIDFTAFFVLVFSGIFFFIFFLLFFLAFCFFSLDFNF